MTVKRHERPNTTQFLLTRIIQAKCSPFVREIVRVKQECSCPMDGDCIPVRMVFLKTKREEQDTILLHL